MTILKKLLSFVAITCALTLSAQASFASAQDDTTSMDQPSKSGYVEVNGVNYYYEVSGKGEPLLLLHGGLGSIGMYEPVLPQLTANREVIAVDLHGHGRTSLGTRPIEIPRIGADMAALVEKLGYGQVDVLGYSFGAWSALHMAAAAPERVRRLVLVSMPYAKDGFFPEMIPQQEQLNAASAEFMKDTPMYKSYVAVAPNPEEFPKLLDQVGRVVTVAYDYSAAVKKLTMPVMLIYGDSDMVRPEHIVSLYQMLGGGLKDAGWEREHMSRNRLAILPDLTHYETFMAPEMVRTALPFLNGESGAKSWAEQVEGAR